jgi:hypothetical protein
MASWRFFAANAKAYSATACWIFILVLPIAVFFFVVVHIILIFPSFCRVLQGRILEVQLPHNFASNNASTSDHRCYYLV